MLKRSSYMAVILACASYPAVAAAASEGSSSTSAEPVATKSDTATDTQATSVEAPASDIVVTAQRKTENIRDVPISITALSGSDLSNLMSGGADLRILSGRVPNLNAESTFGRVYPRFYIRGLGNDDFTVNAQALVALYIDDVVEENPFFKGFPAFDLQRVEVLRGPQGTLYGKNSTAGAIDLVTVKPSQEVTGYARVDYGNLGTTNVEAAIGGPLIKDILSARVSVLYEHRDDWVHNLVTGHKIDGYDDLAARGQLLFTPTPEFKALLQVYTRSLDGGGTLAYGLQDDPQYGELPTDREHIAIDNEGALKVHQRGVNFNTSYDFGPVTLTSITSYQSGHTYTSGDIDGSPRQADINSTAVPRLRQTTEELRLSSNGSGPLSYQGGLYYFHDTMNFWNTTANNTFQTADGLPGFGAYQIAHQWSRSLAVFGQASYKLGNLTLTGGVRYTSDSVRFNQDSASYTPKPTDLTGLPQFNTDPFYAVPGRGPIPLSPLPRFSSTSGKWSKATWDASADYKLSDGINVYARVAQGYHGGVITGQAIFAPLEQAGPETILSYEAGVKTLLLDGRLRVNADIYTYNYKHQQLTAYTLAGDGQEIIELVNSKGGIGKGFEADASFKLTKTLTISGNVGYAHTRVKNGTFVASPTDSTVAVDVGGQPFTFAPKWTGAVSADYRVPVGDDREIFASTDWAYRGRENFALTSFLETGFSSAGYWEGGARLGYRVGRMEASGWVRNLANKKALTSALNVSGYAVFYNDPRTYGIEVTYHF